MLLTPKKKIVLLWFLLLMVSFFSLPLQAKPTLSHATFKALEKIDPYREKQQHQKEIKALLDLKQKVKNKAYDLAIVQQYLAFAYMQQGNYKHSQEYANKALKSGLMPKQAAQSLRYFLAQMALQNNNYQQSITLFQQYLAKANKSNSEVYYLIAFGHYHLSHWEQAEKQLNQAITLQKQVQQQIPEDWYKLLVNIYIEEKNYARAEQTLQQLITITPDQVIWWKLLTQLYLIQEKYQKALASISLAYQNQQLNQDEIQQLIQLYQYNQIPEKAARLLQTLIAAKQLPPNYTNHKLLFQIWSIAKEKQKAAQALNLALKIKPNENDDLLLGQIYMQMEDWAKAFQTLSQINRQALKENGQKQQLDYWLEKLQEHRSVAGIGDKLSYQ